MKCPYCPLQAKPGYATCGKDPCISAAKQEGGKKGKKRWEKTMAFNYLAYENNFGNERA